MKKTWFFAAAVMYVLLGSISFGYSGGIGEPNNPYQIADVNDLLELATDTGNYDKCFILMVDIDLEGQTFTTAIIAPDINNSNYEFDGIAFTGTLDGSGHKIIHFTINGESNYYLGLFGYIDGGQIKNLGLENCTVSGLCVGGLVGWNSTGNINHCYSTGDVYGDSGAGGLIGANSGGVISSCYATGSVSSSDSGVGGLIGYNYESTVDNCYATGDVYGDSGVGGLIGVNFISTVSNCYATGAVPGSSDVGGLIGYSDQSTVGNCFWDTQTSGQMTSAGGTGKTTAEITTLSTFSSAGWDFVATWYMPSGYYPQLLGFQSISFPDVVGMTPSDAQTAIWAADLTVGLITEGYSLTIPAGYITSQFPPAGISINTSPAVNLVVSLGIGAAVPDITGMLQADAQSVITSVGLTVGTVTTVYHDSVPAGRVISQSPAAGALVGPGSWVDLTVSLGQPIVPDVTGMSRTDAQSVITSVELIVGVVTSVYSTSVPVGDIISQSPVGGTLVNIGSVVNLVVSLGFYGSGNGTAEYPYQIANVNDFLALAATPSDYDKCFILITDIDMGGEVFTSAIIAPDIDPFNYDFDGVAFTGVFDGNGHKITNFNIDGGINWYLGLFGVIGSGGQIKDLGLENCTVIGSQYAEDIGGSYDVGGLAGMNWGGIISRCYSTGIVNGYFGVGGLVGINAEGSISNCYSTGTIFGNSAGGLVGSNGYSALVTNCYAAGLVTGDDSVGGFIGYNDDGPISNCFWDTQTSGKNKGAGYGSSVGITGKATAQMQDINTFLSAGWDFVFETANGTQDTWTKLSGQYPCLAWQTDGLADTTTVPDVVSMTQANAENAITAAGLMIWITNIYSDTIAAGTVINQSPAAGTNLLTGTLINIEVSVGPDNPGSGTEEDPYRIGTVGDWQAFMTTSDHWDKHFILIADLDLRNIALTPVGNSSIPFSGFFNGNNHVIRNATINTPTNDNVGLFGIIYGRICDLGLESANINGRKNVGLLVGYSGGAVNNCYSTGLVNGTEDVGGLIGYVGHTYPVSGITGCYSASDVRGTSEIGGLIGYNYGGAVDSCYVTGDVTGQSFVGGLTGFNDGIVSNCYATGAVSGNIAGGLCGANSYYGSISQSYATGKVTGDEYVGGVCGLNYDSTFDIIDCFWNMETSGQTTSDGGSGKTTVEMMALSTFLSAGWDFDTIWYMPSNYYPQLLEVQSITFPDAVGMTLSDAKMAISSTGLAIGIITEAYSLTPEGHIVSQSPPAGISINSGEAVNLVVSIGPGVGVPDVVGMSQTDAQTAIISAGLNTGTVTMVVSTSVPAGYVINQSPVGGARAGTASAVNLVVSLGFYSGGSGTLENPYQIATRFELLVLAITPGDYNKYFVLTEDIDMEGQVFTTAIIAPDTDDNTRDFQDIPFTGTFDGNSHKITHFTIHGGSNDYLGLFGYIVSDCMIKNLGLEDFSINGSADSWYIGGLAGYNLGTVNNCYSNEGTISGEFSIGGLIGDNNGGRISQCYSTCSVTATGSSNDVGGLIGDNNGGRISQCYSTGSVAGTGSSYDVGGLIGYNNGGRFSQCYSTSAVSGYYNVGGLVGGNNNGSINQCFSIGTVSGSSNVGGLVGGNSGNINQCYSIGAVSGSSGIGGLIGADYDGKVFGSFWDTETSGKTNSGGGEGKTTFQMQDIDTFLSAGWDFVNETANGTCDYWQMPAGDGYPVLAALHGYIPQKPAGSGTREDPYRITDANELGTIWYRPSAHYVMANDINLIGMQWSMAVIPEFSGVLDGKGFCIRNLSINGNDCLGLCGKIEARGEIKNLGIENCTISGTFRIGCLTGEHYGTLSDCYSTGTISSSSEIGVVGGLVGSNYSGRIGNCYSTCLVNACGSSVGGLVGSNHSGRISNCYSTGIVNTSGSYVGGLVGSSEYGSIWGCYSTGAVTSISGSNSIGGLIGYDYSGDIAACYAAGAVNGGSNSQGVGGLAGGSGGQIFNCYSTGSVTGGNNVGGLVGHLYKLASNCYSTGLVVGSSNVGGLIGNRLDVGVISTVGWASNCFWDKETSGLTTSDGGTGKTTVDMKSLVTFTTAPANWDFTNETANGMNETWRMCTDEVDYPRLSWEHSSDGDFICPDGVNVEDLDALSECWLKIVIDRSTSDINQDDTVNLADFMVLAQYWGDFHCGLCNGADVTGDGYIDGADLTMMAEQWLLMTNASCRMTDLNYDGKIDLADWAVFAQHWLEGM